MFTYLTVQFVYEMFLIADRRLKFNTHLLGKVWPW